MPDKINRERDYTQMQVRTDLKAGAQGLGDVVANFTHMTGLDRLAKYYEDATGSSCGCDERQAKLNQLFPFSTNKTNA